MALKSKQTGRNKTVFSVVHPIFTKNTLQRFVFFHCTLSVLSKKLQLYKNKFQYLYMCCQIGRLHIRVGRQKCPLLCGREMEHWLNARSEFSGIHPGLGPSCLAKLHQAAAHCVHDAVAKQKQNFRFNISTFDDI